MALLVVVPPPNPTPARVTTSRNVQGCGSISPDGRYVVYCTFGGERELRQIATGARLRPWSRRRGRRRGV